MTTTSHSRVIAAIALAIGHLSAAVSYGATQTPSGQGESTVGVSVVSVTAPFEMPAIKIPDFSKSPRFDITEFGASPENKAANTHAIALAIRQASKVGGGTVIIPKGEWLTGKIHFQSNVNLHVSEGAVLLFSEDPSDYLPAVMTSWEGLECYNYSPLIYAYDCTNVAISGKGTLRAKLDVWRKWYARPPAHMEALKKLYHMAAKGVPVEERQMIADDANLRPHFVQFNRSRNILMEDITIEDSPFWVIHPYLSKDVVIRGVKVKAHGHNNDGVDPEMSQNMLIEDCIFDQGDDAIAVKSGRDQDAWRLNTPSKNIVIRNCYIKNGHQLLAIGSELSGGIENVSIENCRLDKSIAEVGHLLFIKTNERRGGYVKNIFMKNIEAGAIKFGVLGIETDVLYQWRDLVPTYEVRYTPISNVYVENVRVTEADFVTRIQGVESLPITAVVIKNVTVAKILGVPFRNKYVTDFSADPEEIDGYAR